jgi:manganese oxidase
MTGNVSKAVLISALASALSATPALAAINCARVLKARIVAIDQPLMWNRLGAQNINGVMYALERDIVDKSTGLPVGPAAKPGDVMLRPDKRPRPLVLRMAAGDCIELTLTNLLAPVANPSSPPKTVGLQKFLLPSDDQVAGRMVGFSVAGLQPVDTIADQGANVGREKSALVAPGRSITYTLWAEKEGA